MEEQSGTETEEDESNLIKNDFESADDIERYEHSQAFTRLEEHIYTAAELKRNFHGSIYQLKILLLCLWRGMKKKKNFGLITEAMEAEKFDDSVIPYIYNNERRIQFSQAKHSQDNRPLTYANLSNTKNGDFSLVKYFNSFRRIKNNPLFAEFPEKSYILITNKNVEKIDGEILTTTSINETFFYSKEKEFKGYKINVTEDHEIFKLLESQEDLNVIAEVLLSKMKTKGKLAIEDNILSVYHVALIKEMILQKIDNDQCQFHENFIHNSENLSPPARKLRSMFFEKLKLALQKQTKLSFIMQKEIPPDSFVTLRYVERKLTATQKEENAKAVASALAQIMNNEEPITVENNSVNLADVITQQKMLKDAFTSQKKYIKLFCQTLLNAYNYETELMEQLDIPLTTTPYFGKTFTKPVAPDNIESMCIILVKLIKAADDEYHQTNLNDTDAKNLKSLAGHVLVYHKNERCLIFSNAFINEEVPESFDGFRKLLREKMDHEKLDYDDIRILKFKLKNPIFQSCLEDREVKSELPSDNTSIKDDVKEFINKFILVTSPHEKDLCKIINKEASAAKSINLLDSDFVTNHTLVKMLNWMKKKKSTIFKKEKAEKLFKDLNIKISTLMLAGNNSEYCKRLREYFPIETPAFENSFKSRIREFLNSECSILFLTSEGPLCTLAAKVEQSLGEMGAESINGYTLASKDSFVFNPLSCILRLQEDVFNILDKQKTFLIIVYDDDSADCQLILEKVNATNKILLIGLQNSAILETLEENGVSFERDDDENNDFSSLTNDAKTFLLQKTVKFHDQVVRLGEVFDLEAAHDLIDVKIFEQLVCDKEIKLTKKRERYDRYDINYYVSRKFHQRIDFQESIVFKRVLTTDAILIEQKEPSFFIVENTFTVNQDDAEEKYFELCKIYKNVHWLKREFNKIFWVKSQGSIAALVAHQQTYCENESNEIDFNEKSYSDDKMMEFIRSSKFYIYILPHSSHLSMWLEWGSQ